jgi:putative ABC transport system permease protein
MRDWEAYVRERLSALSLDPSTRSQVVEDLAAMMRACQEEALAEGASEEESARRAEIEVPDWQKLAAEIRRIERAGQSSWHRAVVRRPIGHIGRFSMLSGFGQDLRACLRSLRQFPGFWVVSVLTLALGIGANTAIFSMVDTVLLKPLGFEEPDRLVRVFSTFPEKSIDRDGVSSGDVVEWARRSDALEGIGAWYVMGRTVVVDEGAEAAETALVAQVSTDFFRVLRTKPLLGRTFTAEETARAVFNSAASHVGTDPVIVLSHAAWQRRFGSDPSILEKTVALERESWRVIGVMPPDFSFPSREIDFWIPFSFRYLHQGKVIEGESRHDQRYLSAIARVKPGVSLAEAEDQLNAISAALGAELPETNAGWGARLVPLHEDLVGGARSTLLVVFGAVAVVLLVACVNISNLQLVRMGERQKEITLRLALGASRARLLRQFLFENSVLAVLGGTAAIPVALSVLKVLELLLPDGVPRLDEIAVDARVLGFTTALSASVAIFFGLVPLMAGASSELSAALKEASSRTAGSAPRWQKLRKLLVVSEIGMAVALLAAAGLLVRSFDNLLAVDPGFRPEGVVVAPITLDSHQYNSGAKSREYYRVLTEKIRSLEGVVSVGSVTALPMSPIGPNFDRPIWAEGELPPPGGGNRADVRIASPGYFETLGIALRRGRGISDDDRPDSPPVVVINEKLAQQTWPGIDPVGKRLVIDYSTAGTYPYEVVGVVNDLRFYGLRTSAKPELYLAHAQKPYLIQNVAVRTSGDPNDLVPTLRRAVLEVDAFQPPHRVAPLSQLLGASLKQDRFAVLLLGSFAALALALALLGIFGVLSYHVGERTHEVGIRTALGASRREILALILSLGMKLTLTGIAFGMVLAYFSTRWLESLLFAVSPVDPLTFVSVIALLGGSAILACYLPARRAAAVDPVIALRHE